MRYTIGQLAEIIDGDRGKNYPKQDEFYPQGYCLFLNTGNVTKEGFIFEENQFIMKEKDESLRKGKLKRGDIVYTTRGTVGNAGYYNSSVPYENVRINSGMVILRSNGEIVDARFLYQILKSEYYRPYFKQYCTGSAQPQLPIKNFSQIYLNVPDIKTQHRIADILSVYDNLIENNQKQIKLLEEAAQRLYKEWFVDLRFPGHENTKIVDGVPEGWNEKTLSQVANVIMGQSPKSEFYNSEKKGLPFHQGVGSYGVRFVMDDIYSTSYTRIAEPNSILFSVRAPVGRLNITKNKVVIGRGLAAINQTDGCQSYLYYLLKNKFFKDNIVGNGSIFASVSKDELLNQKFLIPERNLMMQFEKIVSQMDKQIENLDSKNKRLIEARDRLLPKLMSGEVEV
jgi:type I restriction enzyme S subunit